MKKDDFVFIGLCGHGGGCGAVFRKGKTKAGKWQYDRHGAGYENGNERRNGIPSMCFTAPIRTG